MDLEQILLVSVMLIRSMPAAAQPSLTPADYDVFYEKVVLQAKNGSREEWLASYDPAVTFITRVRQDVAKLPDATRQSLAKAVHDNGYWKLQELRVRDAADPFVGAKISAVDERLRAVLTPVGFEAYRNRYAQGSKGYRFTLELVADRAAFYRLLGKIIPGVQELPASTTIINANAQSWDDLLADARRYPDPAERTTVIVGNQLNAIASALSLTRSRQTRSDAEMDYATAVIWRYTGHFSGKDGWEKEPLVRIPYAQLPEAERAKDRPVWRAVREALAAERLNRVE